MLGFVPMLAPGRGKGGRGGGPREYTRGEEQGEEDGGGGGVLHNQFFSHCIEN